MIAVRATNIVKVIKRGLKIVHFFMNGGGFASVSHKIIYFWVLVSLILKVIKATFNFSWVSKYSISKTNIDNEW